MSGPPPSALFRWTQPPARMSAAHMTTATTTFTTHLPRPRIVLWPDKGYRTAAPTITFVSATPGSGLDGDRGVVAVRERRDAHRDDTAADRCGRGRRGGPGTHGQSS